jgi:hypothetical protein
MQMTAEESALLGELLKGEKTISGNKRRDGLRRGTGVAPISTISSSCRVSGLSGRYSGPTRCLTTFSR